MKVIKIAILAACMCFMLGCDDTTTTTSKPNTITISLGEPESEVIGKFVEQPTAIIPNGALKIYQWTYSESSDVEMYFENGKLIGYKNLWTNVKVSH